MTIQDPSAACRGNFSPCGDLFYRNDQQTIHYPLHNECLTWYRLAQNYLCYYRYSLSLQRASAHHGFSVLQPIPLHSDSGRPASTRQRLYWCLAALHSGGSCRAGSESSDIKVVMTADERIKAHVSSNNHISCRSCSQQ